MDANNALIDPALCKHLIKDLTKMMNGVGRMQKNQIESIGRAVYAENPNMQDIGEFMEHPATRAFYEKHLDNWGDITITMLYLRLYAFIDKLLEPYNTPDKPLNGYHKLAILDALMSNAETKHVICQAMTAFIHNCSLRERLDECSLRERHNE